MVIVRAVKEGANIEKLDVPGLATGKKDTDIGVTMEINS